MATYYVDPDAGGDDDGTSQANAWTTLQRAIDGTDGTPPAAGDTVYLRHGTGNDEAPGATIDFDVADGSAAARINWIGVNSSWVEDGTRYIIDGGSMGAGVDIWNMDTHYNVFKNIELNNAKGQAIDFEGFEFHPQYFCNCRFQNGVQNAFDSYGLFMWFHRCHFTGNGVDGYWRPASCIFTFCVFAHNTGDGVEPYHGTNIFYGCIFHGNGGCGINSNNPDDHINCIFDGNTGDGIQVDSTRSGYTTLTLGCRITNNAKGLDADTEGAVSEDFNFFLNNAAATEGVFLVSGGNSLLAGTEGYGNSANHDFNLTVDATLRRLAIDLGYGT